MYSYQYPHPAVTTDSVVFGYDGRQLHLLLIERGIDPFKGQWALPGGFVRLDETVEDGAKRELFEETGVRDIYLEQFHTFSDVQRDPRERVITVAFFALVRKSDYRLIAGDDAARANWFTLDEIESLPIAFDHSQIIAMAKEHLKKKLRLEPIAFKLLDERFTLSELQRLYEQINGRVYDRRNFQKKMLASGYLEEMPEPTEEEMMLNYSRNHRMVKPEHTGDRAVLRFNGEEFEHTTDTCDQEEGTVEGFASIGFDASYENAADADSKLNCQELHEDIPLELPKRKLSEEPKPRGRKPHFFSFLSKLYEESDDKDRNLFNP